MTSCVPLQEDGCQTEEEEDEDGEMFKDEQI